MAPLKSFSLLFLLASLTLITKFRGVESRNIWEDDDDVFEYDANERTRPSDEEYGSEEEDEEVRLTWATIVDPSATNNQSRDLMKATVGTLEKFVQFTAENPPELKAPFYVDSLGGFLGIVLRFEIFTKATGRNFVLPPPEDRNASTYLHAQAYALTHSWLKLNYSQTTDHLLNHVVRPAVFRHMRSRKPLTQENMASLLRTVFEKFEIAIENVDVELDQVYKEDRQKGLINYPSVPACIPFDELKQGEVDHGKVRDWLTNRNTIQFLIHQQVLNTVRRPSNLENGTEDDVMLSMVIEISKDRCCFDRNVQEIYIDALMRVTRDFIADEFPHGTLRSLAMNVDKSLDADPHMNGTWNMMKRSRLTRFRRVKREIGTF